jgi:hypothetical protein
MPRRSGQVDETDLKREEGPANERERRTEQEPKPSRPPRGPAAQARTPALRRNRPGWRCDDREQSRSGNRRPSEPASRGRRAGRPPGLWARRAKEAGAGGGANRTAPPGGGSKKCREPRPRALTVPTSTCRSNLPRRSFDARLVEAPPTARLHDTLYHNPAKLFRDTGSRPMLSARTGGSR